MRGVWFGFCLMLAVAASSLAVDAQFSGFKGDMVVLSQSPQSTQLNFRAGALERSEISLGGEVFDLFSLEGQSPPVQPGAPALPTVVRLVLIPPTSGVDIRAEVLSADIIRNVRPAPMLEESELNAVFSGAVDSPPTVNAQTPGGDGFYPPEIVKLGQPAIMRDWRLVPVIINPLRWNPATGELQVISEMDIELDFSSQMNRDNLLNREPRKVSRSAYQMMAQLVVNPPEPPRDVDVQNGSVLYVTGDWNDIEQALMPLVEWRRRMGWSARILRTRNNNDRNAVYNLIRDAYNSPDPPEFVVLCGDADGNYPIACHIHANVGNPYETDHPYACLDGDDILPEVAVGRLIFDGVNMLRNIVTKTVQYESDPFLPEGDLAGWQGRGAVASTYWANGATSNNVLRWSRQLLLNHGYTRVNELYCSPQNAVINPTDFIRTNLTQTGISLFLYRGYVNMNGFAHVEAEQIRNGRALPFIILATCNTGDFLEHAFSQYSYIERFLYSSVGGAIGAVGTGGATHTYYNNCYMAGAVLGLYNEGIRHQGWVLERGKVELFRNYANRNDINHDRTGFENWITHTYVYNLMGDPAVKLFTAVPQTIAVDHPRTFRPNESRVTARVTRRVNDEPVGVPGAAVCLYRSGQFQQLVMSDADGFAAFDLNPEWTAQGTVQLTVTGDNLRPYLADIEVERPEYFIAASAVTVDDDGNGDSRGDGDGVANPTERLELTVRIKNKGSARPNGALNLTLTAVDTNLAIVRGEAQLNQAPAPNDSAQVTFVVDVLGGFPSGKTAVFTLAARAGESEWTSAIKVPVVGPAMSLVSWRWVDGALRPGQSAELTLRIRNSGDKNAPELDAQVISLTPTISAPQARTRFNAMARGDSANAEGAVRLSAHPFHLYEMPVKLEVVLTNENGLSLRVPLNFRIGNPVAGQPFGPDDYGYVCFDNTDTTWFAAPTYDWLEIDTRRGGQGTDLQLNDRGANSDTITFVELPFEFQYYGRRFREITVCTNGWMAMGRHPGIYTNINRRIPGGLVTPAMLCPFWDDLTNGNDGRIFTWFDEQNHKFIVQWSQMRRMMPGQSPVETFQVVLFDPAFHRAFRGDGEILFQYRNVRDDRTPADVYGETPYASVGIASPDLTTGLEYSYWGALHPGAAPLDSGRAVLFTTLLAFQTADIEGRVTDAATGEPMAGVTIQCTYGFWTTTDDDGVYRIPDVVVDTAISYTLTASKRFYNDAVQDGFQLAQDSTLVVDFQMLHPEFTLELDEIDVSIEQENANDFYLPIVNGGNGPLTFESKLLFRAPAAPPRDDVWDRFLEFDATNAPTSDSTVVGNTFMNGVVFVDSLFYVTGGGSARMELPAKFYRYDRLGAFVDSLAQPWIDNRGLRGVAYDGRLIYGGFANHIYRFDPAQECALVDSFRVPPTIPQDIAIDRANMVFYTCGITTPIYQLDSAFNVVRQFNPQWEGSNLRKYGLAFYPHQPDSLKLFIFADLNNACILFGLNLATGELRRLIDLSGNGGDRPLGLDVTDRWNNSVWTLLTSVTNSDGDRIGVRELHPNTTWLSFSPAAGTVAAGGDTTLHIRVEAGRRDYDRYWVVLRYTFNAEPGEKIIPISMRVVEQSGIDRRGAGIPLEFGLEPNWPNPFNPATTLRYNLPEAALVRVAVFDAAGRLVEILSEGRQAAGAHQVFWRADGLPSGVYICKVTAGDRSAARKIILLR